MSMELLKNATFWTGAAFAIFFLLLHRYRVHRKLAQSLDERRGRIQHELDEASRLHAEAKVLLAEYEARFRKADEEAGAIVASAQEEAERLFKDAQERLAEFVRRRTQAAEAKIAQVEAQASAELRAAAADAAIHASEIILRGEMTGLKAEGYLMKSLGEAKDKLN